jgi:hypothetical protein
MKIEALLGFLGIAINKADPLVWPIYTGGQQFFVSPTIGFGPNGGQISVSVQTDIKDSSSFITLLSGPQYETWSKQTDSLEPNALVATLSKPLINGSAKFSKSLLASEPEQYMLVVSFGSIPTDDSSRTVGSITVDWNQSDGTHLQYQMWKLRDALNVIADIVLVCALVYMSMLLMNRRLVNALHYIFLGFLVYTLVFLYAWNNSIRMEQETGDRSSFLAKWIPGLFEKAFDIFEVFLYLIVAVGWKTVRPSFFSNEIQFMVTGGLLSFLLGIFELMCGDDSVEAGNFTSARMIVHMFGYLGVIVGFNYHLSFGSAIVQESSIASRDTAKTYFVLSKFWWFRAIFLCFIVQPTIAVVIRSDILGWEDDWLFVTLFWASKIFLLVAVVFVFRPRPVAKMGIVELAIKQRRSAGIQT